MEIYLVGGAVRDELLGRPVVDRDWVVVGSTPEEMRALGYRPVGRGFPVFLHPDTREEYALARTERKIGPGHQGFVFHADPEVSLEEDLARRDLTVNAMARSASGALVDPFGGQQDLRSRTLRHVSDAFAEDPLRVLRVARFAAELPGFQVAAETLTLMRSLAESGELASLSAERVFQEFRKALAAPAPNRFFEVLDTAQALTPWFPEFEGLAPGFPEPADAGLFRFGGLGFDLAEGALRALSQRLRAPARWWRLGQSICRHGLLLLGWPEAEPAALHEALTLLGAYRDDNWADDLTPVIEARAEIALAPLAAAVGGIREGVDSAPLRAEGLSGPALGQAISARREARLGAWLREFSG